MRRLVVGAAVVGGVVVGARVLAPKLHARMLAACRGMFEHAPEDFPPKKIMGSVEEIRANTTRMLEVLEGRTEARKAKQQEEPWQQTAEKTPKQQPEGVFA